MDTSLSAADGWLAVAGCEPSTILSKAVRAFDHAPVV